MKNKNFTLITFIAMLICTYSNLFAQEKIFINFSNADDVILRKKIIENPQIKDEYLNYEANFTKLAQSINDNLKNLKTDTTINGRRIIPVVVHVLHTYGTENISDAQIKDGIKRLNIDYNKLNADTSAIFPLFKSRAANFQIEFRLAKLDINGNCINGIDRIYDPQTNFAYFSTMSQYVWDPSKYMNVYAVNFIYPAGMSLPDGAMIGGMSPFPPSNTLSQALTGGDPNVDGVLIRQDCIGAIGTATSMAGQPINALNRTFTHEIGHYLNLYHPFQVTIGALLGLDGCGSQILGCGDNVSDTPPVATAAQNTSINCFVPGERNTCTAATNDEPDMVENYMDYQFGYCTNIFTNGQLTRVNATLQGDRKNLWSIENLIATGVLDTTIALLCEPISDFNAQSYSVCTGSSINFFDRSFNGEVDSWIWEFPGGNPATSTSQNPTVSYTTPGIYNVTLTTTNASGSNSKTKTQLISVFDISDAIVGPISEGFESSINWSIMNEAGNAWEVTDTTSYEGTKSLRIMNFSNNNGGSIDEIITPAYNLTSLAAGTLKFKFRYAYAGKATAAAGATPADTVYDSSFRVFVSVDCGNTWEQKFSRQGSAIATTDPVSGSFKPTSQDQWRQIIFSPYSFLPSSNVRYKFQFKSSGANNLYIDNIMIDNTTEIDQNIIANINLAIYPNPINENSVLEFNLTDKQQVEIKAFDILGKEIALIENAELTSGNHKYSISKEQFKNSGFYFVKVKIGNQIFTEKFVIE